MFRFKDRLPLLANSNVIYDISCDACGASYIGKTRQRLSSRFLRGHLSGREESEVLKHTLTHGQDHTFSLDKIKILGSDEFDLNLKIKESLFIKKLKPILNNGIVSVSLNLF